MNDPFEIDNPFGKIDLSTRNFLVEQVRKHQERNKALAKFIAEKLNIEIEEVEKLINEFDLSLE